MTRLLLLLALCLTSLGARAELSQYRERFKLAMEVELDASQVYPLLPLFDWPQMERDIASGNFEPFETNLKKIQALNGRPLSEAPPQLLANLFLDSLMDRYNYPPLNEKGLGPDSPLDGIVWTRDAMKFEFAFDGPTSDPADYLRRTYKFADAVQLRDKFNRPYGKGLPELSFHLHISRNDDKDLKPQLSALNKLILMRMIDQGVHGELFDNSRTTRYYDDITRRGLVRLIDDKNHFEIRRHTQDPETELKEILRWMDMDGRKASREITAETDALLTDKNVTTLFNTSVSAAVSVFSGTKPGLGDARLKAALLDAIARDKFEDVATALETLAKHKQKKVAGAAELLKVASNAVQERIRDVELSEWLKWHSVDAKARIIRVSGEHGTAANRIQTSSPSLGKATEKLFAQNPGDAFTLVRLLGMESAPVRRVALDRLLALSHDETSFRRAFIALGTPILASREGWATMLELMAKPNRDAIAALADVAARFEGFSRTQNEAIARAVARVDSAADRPPGGPINALQVFLKKCWGDRP